MDFERFKHAKRVQIKEGLTTFPLELLNVCPEVEILDLSGNEIEEIPAEIALFKHLRILFLSQNKFKIFPKTICQCTTLEMLGLKSNQIEHIPEDSFPPNLRWLILTDNAIAELPVSIGNCHRMQKLMLAGNQLKSLPASFSKFNRLELLRISANHFQEIPSVLKSLPNLSWLAFGNETLGMPPSNRTPKAISWYALEILELLGQGASGQIFKAKWPKNNSFVAVKLYKGHVTSDGWAENEIRNTLFVESHPTLVPVLGQVFDHPEGKKALVMELIPNHFFNMADPPSFESCTRDVYSKPLHLEWEVAIEILKQKVDFLVHLHKQKIMHGDVYPHNTLLTNEGKLLTGDFGAASFYGNEKDHVWFEKMEVRAFGCFLEDVLNQMKVQKAHVLEETGLVQLETLAKGCFLPDYNQRPTLIEIQKALDKM